MSAPRPALRVLALVAPAAALLALGCAKPPPSLGEARAAYERASRDPQVAFHAPVPLYEAEKALKRAERSWQDERDAAAADHLAFLASKRVEVARARAEGALAGRTLEQLSEERDQMVIRARTIEAGRAQRRASRLEQELRELEARQTARGMVITLGDVLFDFGQADLKPGAKQNLFRLAVFLREQPEREVVIEGHTDNFGPAEINAELSRRRAEAVGAFLEEHGVEPYRMVAEGLGEEYPIVSNATPAGRQRNRRVEVVILEPGQSALEQRLPRRRGGH